MASLNYCQEKNRILNFYLQVEKVEAIKLELNHKQIYFQKERKEALKFREIKKLYTPIIRPK
jgi:hypothetical protein